MSVPAIRIRAANQTEINTQGEFVLYWMIAFRRSSWNFSFDRALEWSVKLGKPLVVFEAIRLGYPWASDRLHTFILEGMADQWRALSDQPVLYYPYVERRVEEGKGLLQALSKRAAVVVTDDFPCFMLPAMVGAAAAQSAVLMEAVDSNGLLPLRAATTTFPTAFAFRRFLQKNLPAHLSERPAAKPFAQLDLPVLKRLPEDITSRWQAARFEALENPQALVSTLPIDHNVMPSETRGGTQAAQKQWREFLTQRLPDYCEKRNEPEEAGASGLSPYLHFGHISVHQIFWELSKKETWSLAKIPQKTNGKKDGFWKMSAAAQSFLDELITWRELGYNFCALRPDYDAYESLPPWALKTLADHAKDRRAHRYTLQEFERAQTHDALWNAAQRQLVREGRIHNYLRMLWGKKILEWSPSPQEALEIMIELNNKYALDGRNPNSYSGIFWTLGRYDHPWPPERPVFGSVRYMSSENTARKFSVKEYLARYAPHAKH